MVTHNVFVTSVLFPWWQFLTNTKISTHFTIYHHSGKKMLMMIDDNGCSIYSYIILPILIIFTWTIFKTFLLSSLCKRLYSSKFIITSSQYLLITCFFCTPEKLKESIFFWIFINFLINIENLNIYLTFWHFIQTSILLTVHFNLTGKMYHNTMLLFVSSNCVWNIYACHIMYFLGLSND